MSTPEMSTVVSSDARRFTIVNMKQVNELPLRNALQSFDKNGDGKIDISELQKIIYWYGLWKYASFGLCLIIMTLVWSTFGLTIWAINLTKDYTVTNGVLTGGDEVVKMSVASTHIPLSWASLLDRRHLDALESLSIDVTQGSGKFSSGVYHMKVASYLHANSTYLKLFGQDGSRVWVNSGTVVLHHPVAEEAIMVCGAAACNTMAVDVKPDYLEQLVQRSVALYKSSQDFELPSEVDGVAINKAEGKNVTCKASIFDKNKLAWLSNAVRDHFSSGNVIGNVDGKFADFILVDRAHNEIPGKSAAQWGWLTEANLGSLHSQSKQKTDGKPGIAVSQRSQRGQVDPTINGAAEGGDSFALRSTSIHPGQFDLTLGENGINNFISQEELAALQDAYEHTNGGVLLGGYRTEGQ